MGITEAFCIFLSPFVLATVWPKFKETQGKKLLLFLVLWFLSACVTDFYRETEWNDAARGIFALPFLFAVFVVAFALLWDDLMRVRWMVLGTAISAIISMYYFQAQALIGRAETMGGDIEEIMNFKTYYAGIVFLVVCVLVVLLFRNWPLITVWILLISSVVFLIGGSRSGFLTLLISAGGAYLAQNRFLSLRALQRNIAMLAVFACIGGLLAMETYAYAAEEGWMGEEEYAKYETQSESEIGLLSGRAEFIGSLIAIKDSPILGHGSWAVDKENYGVRMLEYIGEEEAALYRDRKSSEQDMWLPTHSHLWQAWVWHGFLGGLFWIFVLVLMLRFFKHSLHLCRPLIAYNILLLVSALWALLFSPFSDRPRWGIIFAIILLALAEVERRRKKAALAGVPPDMETEWDGKWNA